MPPFSYLYNHMQVTHRCHMAGRHIPEASTTSSTVSLATQAHCTTLQTHMMPLDSCGRCGHPFACARVCERVTCLRAVDTINCGTAPRAGSSKHSHDGHV